MNPVFSKTKKYFKKLLITFCFAGSCFGAFSQSVKTLTIDDCYRLATGNYPLIRQKEILKSLKEYSLDNAAKGYLPQIAINGQMTYQSDVTKIPFNFPDLNIPSPSKDQYKAYVEIAQPLTDGVLIKQQSKLIEANTAIEDQKLEVELYPLKERVNQLYFGILLIRAQIEQVALLKKDIQSGIDKTNAAIANGTAVKSSAEILKAELLKSDQRTIELMANLKGYIQVLALLINQSIDDSTNFEMPPVQPRLSVIHRPELKLFDVQYESYDVQQKLLDTRKLPKVGVFLQGGYGKPALNLLNNKFDFYYFGGLKFNWSLSGLYTSKNDKQILILNQHLTDIKRETFLLNTNLALTQQEIEIKKLEELINVDDQIIALYEGILNSYSAQLENGTITTNDYLTHINAIDVARQNLILHRIQLLMAQYVYKTTSGN